MAGETTGFTFHRGVWKTVSFAGIFVAIETEVIPGIEQQAALLRGVGIMAGEALT